MGGGKTEDEAKAGGGGRRTKGLRRAPTAKGKAKASTAAGWSTSASSASDAAAARAGRFILWVAREVFSLCLCWGGKKWRKEKRCSSRGLRASSAAALVELVVFEFTLRRARVASCCW